MLEPFSPVFFRRLQQLKIHTRRSFLGSRQGVHSSLRRGHGLEFSDYRLYAEGDDFRHIDWGAYGRTDRLYLKQFREEQDLNVIVILDASASMGYPKGENKFEMARNLSLALGYVAMTDGDSVTFSILGKKNSPKFRGRGNLSKVLRELSDIAPDGKFNFVQEVRKSIINHKLPGKCFLISDFLFDHETQVSAIDVLRYRNFDISVIQIISPSETVLNLASKNVLVVDSENGQEVELSIGQLSQKEYSRLMSAHIDKLEHYCRKRQISYVLIKSEESLTDVILRRFPAVGILK